MLRILLASLREQPAHVSSQRLFFGASDQLGIMPQGRHTGIETGESATKKARFAVLPRVPPELVLICGRSQAVLRGTSLRLRELVQVGLLQPRLPESVPGPLRFAPSLRKQATLDGIFVAIIFFQFEHTDGLWVSVRASIFLVLLHRLEMTGDLSLLVVQDTVHELTLQPHQSANA